MKDKKKPTTIELSCRIKEMNPDFVLEWLSLALGLNATIERRPKQPSYLKIYLQSKSKITEIQKQLLSYSQSSFSDFKVTYIPFDHWASRWKKGLKHITLSKHLVIRPSWVHYQKKSNEAVIQIDPGMAFGTGHHPTTRICLDWINQYARSWSHVCDLGCGSGILSIVALKRGVQHAWAIDKDQESIQATIRNTRLNRLHKKITCQKQTLSHKTLPHSFDAVFANLTARVIKNHWNTIAQRVKAKNGMLLLSGIHESHSDEFHQWLIKRRGWHIIERKQKEKWIGYLLVRADNRKQKTESRTY